MLFQVDGDMVIYEVVLEEGYTKTLTNKSPFRWVSPLLLTDLSVVINQADEIVNFSLQVQCEYEVSDLMRAASLRSLYPVTSRPAVVALGSFRVLMRIAQGSKKGLSHLGAAEKNPVLYLFFLDSTFTSFLPEDQLPLSLPLREAAYVEVAIAQPSPDPTLSLRVRDCFAYPASRHSVWTLLYDGWVAAARTLMMQTRLQSLLFPPSADAPTLWTTWEALSLWITMGRPRPTPRSGGLTWKPLHLWTHTQAILAWRKYDNHICFQI